MSNKVLNDLGKKQNYGKNPKKVRETDKYQEEYVHRFVEKWDELIDWDAREEGEGTFFIDELKRRNKKKVLDVATGTGYHSVKLLKNGLDVWSVDGSPVMLAKAFENARKRGEILKTIHADWRWLNKDVHGRFDAIICLGNSFTHLFSENDRRKSLAEFYSALKHDGILIIDHRNYDAILDDDEFISKHTYYYAGDKVKAAPEYVDQGLARFRYEFPDNSEFHLNMFPLREQYMKNLLREVGFQKITTYGDFQETHKADSPDFFVHIAEKGFAPKKKIEVNSDELVTTTKSYYDSDDADEFYFNVWGGEDIHVGIYNQPDESIFQASKNTVDKMISVVGSITKDSKILDLGAGYGGAARHLASQFGCTVTCLNLSDKENERNEQKNKEASLEGLIEVRAGNYEDIPYTDEQFDIVWSQDAILHSGNKPRVLKEAYRVLQKGGDFIFTDPMQSDHCPDGVLTSILERIHLKEMGSVELYKYLAEETGFEIVDIVEMPEQLVRHYSRVKEELEKKKNSLLEVCSKDYLEKMQEGLQHWIEGGKNNYLNWGILHFRKP